MSITINIDHRLREHYEANGISSVGPFTCKHLKDCKGDCQDFTEARAAFVGRKYGYGKGALPSLLFISLDPGAGEPDNEDRTIEGVRREEEKINVAELPKGKYWFLTQKWLGLSSSSFVTT